MTTIDTITSTQIRTLRDSAGEAGDSEMYRLADLALSGRLSVRLGEATQEDVDAARLACVEAIRATEAQS